VSKSKSIGVIAALVLILSVVSVSVLKNASSAPGITLREPEVHGPVGAAPIAGSGAPSGGGLGPAGRISATNSVPSEAGVSRPSGSDAGSNDAVQVKAEIVVQVAGAVKRPGVYHLRTDARNDDAVKAAGGLGANANAASANLAAHAVDGSQLYIKTLKEQPVGGVDEVTAATVSGSSGKVTAGPTASVKSSRTATSNSKRAAGGKPAKLKDPSEGKININTASAEELQRITGIGPSMADKIIAYRQENHGFLSLEDIMQVRGVGAKTFAKWEPFLKLR